MVQFLNQKTRRIKFVAEEVKKELCSLNFHFVIIIIIIYFIYFFKENPEFLSLEENERMNQIIKKVEENYLGTWNENLLAPDGTEKPSTSFSLETYKKTWKNMLGNKSSNIHEQPRKKLEENVCVTNCEDIIIVIMICNNINNNNVVLFVG
jgi:hypothetical protein